MPLQIFTAAPDELVKPKKRSRPTDGLFRLARFQPRDESFTAPKFHRTAIHELPGPLDCNGIVIAAERLEVDKMPVESDGISPVVCHSDLPHAGCTEHRSWW